MDGISFQVCASVRRRPHADSILDFSILRPPKDCQAQTVVKKKARPESFFFHPLIHSCCLVCVSQMHAMVTYAFSPAAKASQM